MDGVFTAALGAVKGRFRSLMVFAIVFRLLQAVILGPLLAMGGRALVGRPVVDSTELVQFIVSPRGLVDVFLSSAILITLYLMEQAGLSAIALGQLHRIEISVSDALRLVGGKAWALVRLSALLIFRIGLILLPLLAVAAFFARRLLGAHDINYYLARRPPEAMWAAVIMGLVGLATVLWVVRNLVAWRLSVHAVAFEDAAPAPALKRSSVLAHRAWARLLAYWGGVAVVGGLIAAGAVWLSHHAGLTLLDALTGQQWIAVASVVLMAAVSALIHGLVGAAVAVTDATVFTTAFDKLRASDGAPLAERLERIAAGADVSLEGHRIRIAVATGLVLLIAGGVAVWRVGESLVDEHAVEVSAHRGSSLVAPENSLSAFRRAITDGADWLEIDVQETLDGALVVVHDADLARLAGVPRRVSEMTLSEIQAIDIGTPFDSAFRGERVATLDEVLDLARGHIGVNIELKYYPGEKQLARKVVDAVQSRSMQREIVIQSLTYDGLVQVRRLAPDLEIGYLIPLEIKDPWGLDVDFYSANSRLITPRFVLAAHRRGRDVYAWTVDDSTMMVTLDAMGVDNFITNDPVLARRVLRGDATLGERRLRRLRSWLGG